MLKSHAILVSLLALLFSMAVHANASFEDACAALPGSPLITVTALPVTVDGSIVAGDMRTMTLNTTGAESIHERTTVGTTVATRVWELSYGLNAVSDAASGRVCYRPVMRVTIGYDPLRISVAHPFASGSCAYDAIVGHEREHVRIYEQFLPEAARAIERQVNARIGNAVRHATSTAAATAEMRRTLGWQVHEIVREEMARSQLRHAHFDSAEESLRLLNSCNGEVRRALSREVLARR